MTENNTEIDLEIAGQHVRTKGYRLVDLIWLPMALGIAYICLTLYQHDSFGQADKATLAKTLTESNQGIATTLRESNAALAEALKSSNAATTQAIRELTIEQRRATDAIREVACLSDPVAKNRADAREFCKRMSRSDR